MPTWEELIAESNDEDGAPGDDDVTLVSKAQLRLDAELQASGYSEEDAARDSELAYFSAHQGVTTVDEEEDEEGEESEDEEEVVEEDEVATPEADNIEDDEQAPELVNMDDFRIDDNASLAAGGGNVSISGMSHVSRVSTISYAEAEERARERVRRHLEDRKRASGRKGAFKTRNSNKSYAKGKRVMNDFGL